MKKFGYLLWLCGCLLLAQSKAQKPGYCIGAKNGSPVLPVDSIDAAVSQILKGDSAFRFYMLSEVHAISVNHQLQRAFIEQLSDQQALIVWREYCHSLCFLENMYLKTGDKSFLKLIDSTASFPHLKAIREHNLKDTMHPVYFYGIDYELNIGGDEALGFRDLFKAAIEVLRNEAKIETVDSLMNLYMLNIRETDDEYALSNLKRILQERLMEELSPQQKEKLGNYFDDLYLILNAESKYRPNRDDAMFFAMNFVHSIPKRKGTKYLMSIGGGHQTTNAKYNLRKYLGEKNALFRDSVCYVGSQYLQCKTSFSSNGQYTMYENIGDIELMSDAKTANAFKTIFAEEDKNSFVLLRKHQLQCLKTVHKGFSKSYHAFFFFHDFEAAGSWQLR
jgi:hypothetical protein